MNLLRSPDASWHADYRDTAYIYIGGLPFELSEGDIITIFSQFGEPTYVNLIRDKETGKSKGFAFLKYEDQRSTDMAVDNLGGATIMNRIIRVDHTRYKKRDDEQQDDQDRQASYNITEITKDGMSKPELGEDADGEPERPMLREEHELAILIREHDDDDPMKAFLIQEKKEEISVALARLKDSRASKLDMKNQSRLHHHHHHRSRRSGGSTERGDSKRHLHRPRENRRRRSRSRDGVAINAARPSRK
jgi:RNA-binding motif protein, X-linked 2